MNKYQQKMRNQKIKPTHENVMNNRNLTLPLSLMNQKNNILQEDQSKKNYLPAGKNGIKAKA